MADIEVGDESGGQTPQAYGDLSDLLDFEDLGDSSSSLEPSAPDETRPSWFDVGIGTAARVALGAALGAA